MINIFFTAAIFITKPLIWNNKKSVRFSRKKEMNQCFKTKKYAVYLDSRDENTISITNKWFEHGFLNKKDTIIVFRYYPTNLSVFIKKLRSHDFDFVGYHKFQSLDVNSLECVFYPFNTNTNPLLIKNQKLTHIFIGHGESDKEASINPMLRMYHHILIAGTPTQERYLAHNIINNEDIAQNRVPIIGMPYVKKRTNEFNRNIVLYCPTWEGGSKAQEYSSLENDYGKSLLKIITSQEKVIFKPHPSLGVKNEQYFKYVEDILKEFEDEPNFIFLPSSDKQKKLLRTYPFIKSTTNENIDWSIIKMCYTDTSSMVSTAAYHSCPTTIILKHKSKNTTLEKSAHQLLDFHKPDSLYEKLSNINYIDAQKAANQYTSLFTSNSINNLSNREIFKSVVLPLIKKTIDNK